jgi:hypothetical protein
MIGESIVKYFSKLLLSVAAGWIPLCQTWKSVDWILNRSGARVADETGKIGHFGIGADTHVWSVLHLRRVVGNAVIFSLLLVALAADNSPCSSSKLLDHGVRKVSVAGQFILVTMSDSSLVVLDSNLEVLRESDFGLSPRDVARFNPSDSSIIICRTNIQQPYSSLRGMIGLTKHKSIVQIRKLLNDSLLYSGEFSNDAYVAQYDSKSGLLAVEVSNDEDQKWGLVVLDTKRSDTRYEMALDITFMDMATQDRQIYLMCADSLTVYRLTDEAGLVEEANVPTRHVPGEDLIDCYQCYSGVERGLVVVNANLDTTVGPVRFVKGAAALDTSFELDPHGSGEGWAEWYGCDPDRIFLTRNMESLITIDVATAHTKYFSRDSLLGPRRRGFFVPFLSGKALAVSTDGLTNDYRTIIILDLK